MIIRTLDAHIKSRPEQQLKNYDPNYEDCRNDQRERIREVTDDCL